MKSLNTIIIVLVLLISGIVFYKKDPLLKKGRELTISCNKNAVNFHGYRHLTWTQPPHFRKIECIYSVGGHKFKKGTTVNYKPYNCQGSVAEEWGTSHDEKIPRYIVLFPDCIGYQNIRLDMLETDLE